MKARIFRPLAAVLAVVALAIVVVVVAMALSREFLAWQIDLLRGYTHTFPSETVKGYDITLINRAGGDFYDTYFEIRSAEGKTYRLWVDGDDQRWSAPQTKVVGGKIYYLPKPGTSPSEPPTSTRNRA